MAKKEKKEIKTRKTVYNTITTPEKLDMVNPVNLELLRDFLDYLVAEGKSPETIKQYDAMIKVFFCWNLDYNRNMEFVNVKKKDIARFQSHCLNVWGWSPARLKTVKSSLSSMSTYIEDMLDDEYPDFRNIIHKIKSPTLEKVREKSVFTDKEIDELLAYLVAHEQYDKACMLSLAVNSGRRKSELILFKAHYFDDDNVIFDGGLYRTPEKVRTKGHGKIGKLLNLYVVKPEFDPYLQMWLQYRKLHKIKSEWLFPEMKNGKPTGDHISASVMDSWAKTFTNKLGKPFYWHSTRHFFTTKLAKSGLPEGAIQTIVGWESADMVRLYDDTPVEEQLEKYFDSNGIVSHKKKSLVDFGDYE